jgi:hypothetical protein
MVSCDWSIRIFRSGEQNLESLEEGSFRVPMGERQKPAVSAELRSDKNVREW